MVTEILANAVGSLTCIKGAAVRNFNEDQEQPISWGTLVFVIVLAASLTKLFT